MTQSPRSADAHRAVYLARDADELARRHLGRLLRLRDEGIEVDVLAGAGSGLGELAEHGINARPIPVSHPHNVAGLLGAYFIVQAHLFEHRPLFVHAFGHRVAWLGAFAAEQASVPAVFVTLEFHWLEEDPIRFPLGPVTAVKSETPRFVRRTERSINAVVGAPYRRTMHRAYRWLADRVDRYIVTTEFDFQLVQDLEIIAPDKLEIAIGGAGVDLDEYSLGEEDELDRQRARRDLKLPGHWRQVVGYAGPVTRRHGADDLLEAIDRLEQTHPSVGWLIVARGRLPAGQGRRLRRLERRGRLRLIETRRENSQWFRAMDVLAWLASPSTPHDAIAEAAAMAVPTIGYETPGARSLVEQGQTGHLVYEGDLSAAIDTLGAILNDPKRLANLGWRARTRANLRFSRRAVDDQILRLYDRVLEQQLATT